MTTAPNYRRVLTAADLPAGAVITRTNPNNYQVATTGSVTELHRHLCDAGYEVRFHETMANTVIVFRTGVRCRLPQLSSSRKQFNEKPFTLRGEL